ncbi:MAG: methyltransferase domain-containing protein [Microthrixaceae bacterium]
MTVRLECRDSGGFIELPVGDWSSVATDAEIAVLAAARPAVIDIGCGPGRVAHALSARGTPAMGIDVSPAAVNHARMSGATALERSVFDPLPAEGRWGTAILFDGNIGIGGDPVALLRRVADLLAPDGLLLVEVGAPGTPTLAQQVRLLVPGEPAGPWFCWARVSVDSIEEIGLRCGLDMLEIRCEGGRHFAWLRTPPANNVAVPANATVLLPK